MTDVSKLGMGAMLAMLSGNHDTAETFRAAKGKKITAAALVPWTSAYRSICSYGEDDLKALRLTFDDGSGIEFYDDAQSCCEYRYMHTDDDLSSLVGGILLAAEVRDGGTTRGDYGVETECQFLVVETDKGSATVANYNSHNGYYGGFALRVRPVSSPSRSE